ncbi:MAG: cytochrome c-type biogenesis CcmF C-terminal domain-containing protein [Acidimicrobiia bacterium]
MNPRIALGVGGLALGVVCAVFGIAFLYLGLRTVSKRLLRRGRLLSVGTFVSMLVSLVAMEWALLSHDFSIAYVAGHNARGTPFLYTVTGLWAALEGSILLWAAILTGYVAFMAFRTRRDQSDSASTVALIVALFVAVFFFVMLLGPANPFAATEGLIPADGRGPNPLLASNALMAFHPPMLYLGYVGFVVPFAFTVGSLLTGRVDDRWVVATRRSTLFAWICLTIGIMLGAWWSYAVLGWGGYWAWDPVENASLLPWLTGTALLHSIMVQEQRPSMRTWNVSLVVSTFALTILGTFLTRSGVVASVHAFSQSPIGPWLLAFLAVIVIGSLLLIAVRGDALAQTPRPRQLLSREGAFAANNMAFTVLATVVLLGTVFPLFARQFGNDELSIGPPYFDRFAAPLGLLLLLLMAVAPLLPWGASDAARLESRLIAPSVSGAAVMAIAVIGGVRSGWALAGFGMATFAAVATIGQIMVIVSARARANRADARPAVGWTALLRSVWSEDRRRLGGLVVHLGVVVVAVAITASQQFATKTPMTLKVGESRDAGGFRIKYLGRTVDRESDRIRVSARLAVSEGGESIGELSPSVSVFTNANQAVGVPAIDTGITQDLYITLVSSPTDTDQVELTVATNPMVGWLWFGGAVVGLGAAISLSARRRGADREAAS